METRQELVYESVRNCVLALKTPTFDRREIAGLRAELEQSANALRDLYREQLNTNQVTGADGKQIATFRRDVRSRLLRISSHAVATLEGVPGIEEDVRMPHANAKNAELLDATTRIIRNVRAHLKTLHKTGLPKDSIARLDAAAKALAAKADSSDTAIARRSRATSSIPAALRRARKIVKALDATIKLEFADKQLVLLEWSRAKRIPRKIGRPKNRRRVYADA